MIEFYTEKELELIEAYIERTYGSFDSVLHEIASPDIHVDICVIEPRPERNYYTLVTMGMGAHRMSVPHELADMHLERAELAISLPPDWKLDSDEERWYWPVRWLKILARLPIEEDSWLGWGHTISNPGQLPFAENTGFSGLILLTSPGESGQKGVCRLPDGAEINFYDVVPLYREELDYKIASSAEELLDLFQQDREEICLLPVDLGRKNVCMSKKKRYAIKAEDMEQLLPEWVGPEGCLATDRITVDSMPVGYCYREEPAEGSQDWDSGWRFMAGDESDEYMDDAENSSVYSLNTICNYDMEIIPFLRSPYGTAFERGEDGQLRRIWDPETEAEPERRTSLLGPADIRYLEECCSSAAGYFGRMAAYLDEFIETGIREGRFTQRQAREDLDIALWYSYAYNNLDEYRWYYMAAQWMPFSEKYARGCGTWYYRYSVALAYCARLEEAWEYAEKGAVEDPDYPWIWLQLGKLRSHFGDTEGALAAVRQGLELEPGDYEFLTLRQEILEGRSLEEMEFHYIDEGADQDLKDGEDYGETLAKRAAVSGIVCSQEGLERFMTLFEPESWEEDAPFCSFNFDSGDRMVELVFCMNHASVSKLDFDWLVQLREKLCSRDWGQRYSAGLSYELAAAIVYWDHGVELIYENEEQGQAMRVAVSPDGAEQEIEDDFNEQGGAEDGLPSMVKLYLQEGETLSYAEVWIDGDIVTEHVGVCGETGEVTECQLDSEDGWQEYLTGFLKCYYEQGYDQWPDEDLCWIVVQFPVAPAALQRGAAPVLEPADEALREAAEMAVNEGLGWTGLGMADGWEAGRRTDDPGAFVLNLYCVAVNCQMALAVLREVLEAESEVDCSHMKIAAKEAGAEAYQLIYSADGSSGFSL